MTVNSQDGTHILILAAGKGTRMRSSLPKIMHPLAGLPLIGHVLSTAQALLPKSCTLVIAPEMNEVRAFAEQFYPQLRFAAQAEQLGTGHAVTCALATYNQISGKIVIIFGDTPLIQPATLKAVEQKLDTNDIVVVGMTPEDPKHYARIILEDDTSVQKIVEYKDATPEERSLPLCNSGIIGFQADCLQKILPAVKVSPVTGEFYLFETIALAKKSHYKVGFLEAPAAELEGVNTRVELAHFENVWQQHYREKMMLNGVTLLDPQSVYFSYDTQIGQDTVIEPHVYFGPNVLVEENAQIRAFCHIEGTTIRQGARIGPFARLRPHTDIGVQAHVGNFVEIKESVLGRKAKANHLTYLGDTIVGEETNIGAGTITCNYDGFNKWQTKIGPRVFIGSNTALIAPVTINADAVIGAGSTITRDVEEDALALSRAMQKSISGGAVAFRHKCQTLQRKKG